MQIQRISPAYVAAALSGGCPGQTTCTHCQQLRPPLETLKAKIPKIGAFLRGSRAPPGQFQRWLLVSGISV